MEIKLTDKRITDITDQAIIVFSYECLSTGKCIEEMNRHTKGLVIEAIKQGDFSGKKNQVIYFYHSGNTPRIILIGLGKQKEFDNNILRNAVSKAIEYAKSLQLTSFSVFLEKDIMHPDKMAFLVTEAALMTDYRYTHYKPAENEKPLNQITLVMEDKRLHDKVSRAISDAKTVAQSVILARDLVNTPASTSTPEYIANKAAEIAKQNKLKMTVFDKKEITKQNMNGLLAVNAGSHHEPKFVMMEYSGGKKGEKPYILVGKGITFDSGGLNIKPSSNMETMKEDMAGAAAVIYAMKALSELKVKKNIIAMAPLTENMISPLSYKPGDIIKMSNGKTIEVLNTDAEGRIILADALIYASKRDPEAIIDIATLTGACAVALGTAAAGVMGNDDEMIKKLQDAGYETYERLWQLPMFDEYTDLIKSDFADIKNVVSNSAGYYGGAMTAAAFLEYFIGESRWVHIDIAGTAWADSNKGYLAKGGTGFGIRLLVQFFRNMD